jgi:hypothetical protein
MASSPYIVTTDDLTTAQELAIARNTRARILTTAQQYEIGTPRRMKMEAELKEVNATILQLQNQLASEDEASAGSGGLTNLVRFTRPL